MIFTPHPEHTPLAYAHALQCVPPSRSAHRHTAHVARRAPGRPYGVRRIAASALFSFTGRRAPRASRAAEREVAPRRRSRVHERVVAARAALSLARRAHHDGSPRASRWTTGRQSGARDALAARDGVAMAIARTRARARARAGASARAGARALGRRRTTTTRRRRRRRGDDGTGRRRRARAHGGMEDVRRCGERVDVGGRAGDRTGASWGRRRAPTRWGRSRTRRRTRRSRRRADWRWCGSCRSVVDAAWKFLLFPSLVAVGAIAAMAHPVETLKFLERAAEEISTHPEEAAAALAIATAIALGPYILGAALVALVISGTSILPSAVKPVLPREFVAATERFDAIVEAANAKEREVESFARDVNAKRTELRAKRLGQATPPRDSDAQTGRSSRSAAVPEFSPATSKSPATPKAAATSKRREIPRRVAAPSPSTQTTTSPREKRLKNSTPLERRRAMNDGTGAR